MAVVVSALVKGSRILLIKRARGDYVGLWSLPGGKIEKDEHVSEAAVREVKEETGINSAFKRYLGVVSEHLTEGGSVRQHFMLHFCELVPETSKVLVNIEGEAQWFGRKELKEMEGEIIPSDFLMIDKMLLNREKRYYNCIIEKDGSEHTLRKFE